MLNIEKIFYILEEKLKDYTIPLAEQVNIKTLDPFFVLVGVILSARTKDETTKRICDRLFLEVKSFDDLRVMDINRLENLIYGVGFHKNKAKNLKLMANQILTIYNGVVPRTLEELISLSGVGRKSANLVLSFAFDIDSICVDTHVHRIMNRIGYVKTKYPQETEFALRDKLPKKYWKKTNNLFVILGQNICKPIKPNCNVCPINSICEKNHI